MSRDAELWLRDIAVRCERILFYTEAAMTLDRFLADNLTRDAVERNFQVIGDAIKALPSDILASEPEIAWSMFARFRDIVTHSYFKVDPIEVWNASVDEVPGLLDAIRRMLGERGPANSD